MLNRSGMANVRGFTRAPVPSPQREVITLRDVEGRSPADACDALDVSPDDERHLLNQARGHVRARLASYLEEGGT